MKILYISILAALLILWIFAKLSKPVLPTTENSWSRVFLPPAAMICTWFGRISGHSRRVSGRVGRALKDQKLSAGLTILYPGETAERSLYRYRVELVSTILLVVACGTVVCLITIVNVENEGILTDGDLIYRNTYGGEDVEADLSAGIAGDPDRKEFRLDVRIPARIYSGAEADRLFEQMADEVDMILLGENADAAHILHPVKLIRNVDGYPFAINWECSNYELLDYDGIVHNEELSEPVFVKLTADCTYMTEHRYLVRDLRICPRDLTADEMILEEIRDAVDSADSVSSTSESVRLPDRISAGVLVWRENLNDISPLILLGVFLVSVLIIPFKESEIGSRLKSRSSELLIDYPSFVSQLTLFMGAGMSVRNCLIGMGRKAAVKRKRPRTYLEKELIITGHELEVGISDAEAIEHFGKRCGTREYMRFAALLIQNMRKGSADLIGMLQEESADAFVLRKNEARKLGEEASTKMLLPMVMMLTVVMIIIMVPAYMSFSS